MDYFLTPTPLFKSIESQNLKKTLHILQTKPEQASIWIVRRCNTSLPPSSSSGSSPLLSSATNRNPNVVWKRLPIHEACLRNPCVNLMEALINAYPTGMKLSDAAGRLPLHHACIHGVNEQVILKMILVHPESMLVEDMWGKTPLKVLEASTHKEKKRIVGLLEKGPGYYFRRVVEEEMIIKKEKERQRTKEEFENYKKRHQQKLASMEETLYQERLKFQEREANHTKQFIDLVTERDQMKAQKERMMKEHDALLQKSKKWRGTVDDSASGLMKLRTEMNEAHIEHSKVIQKMNKNLMTSNRKGKKDAQEILRLTDLLQRTKKSLKDHQQMLKQNETSKKQSNSSHLILQDTKKNYSSSQQENTPLEPSTSSFAESMCVRVGRLTSENKALVERNKDLHEKLLQVDHLSQLLLTLSASFESLDTHKDSLVKLAEDQRAEIRQIESMYEKRTTRIGKSKHSFVSKMEKDISALRSEFALPRV